MTRYLLAPLVLSLSLALMSPAIAEEKIDAQNPCVVTLCLWGEVTGHSASECHDAIKTFFNINAFKKHHHFNPSKTFSMRQSFLKQCPDARPDEINKIMSTFGRMKR